MTAPRAPKCRTPRKPSARIAQSGRSRTPCARTEKQPPSATSAPPMPTPNPHAPALQPPDQAAYPLAFPPKRQYNAP